MSGAVISLRVDGAQMERLKTLAERTGRPMSFYVREALDAHLEEIEYVYQLEAEAEAVRRGELQTIGLSELRSRLGLED
ncbi:ribbon-helix-helix domain-containing protein [Corynebacterium sp. TA-R-1]|uniref:Ribbon-helix-helix domain-containing protein n=1 Tax=Corynebacterium stercoris TaxID=2943490 RepID=A0ABT1FYF8_9CORY|nr:ribbon-helix-helix domain-containing protein [Corynebacterium stercoris]MCP1386779.1 ribbon-helix-helix domain-containing protein [Corynebacterium stercoris]